MMDTARSSRWLPYRIVVGLVLVAGLVAGLVSYRLGRADERTRAEADFVHHATVRHALTREILGHFEDALFGLSTLFISSDDVTLAEFQEATQRIGRRMPGVQAFDWVPEVPHEVRAQLEAELTRSYGRPVEFVEFGAKGERRRAAERPRYYPIAYMHPLRGNEAALGYDLSTAPTFAVLERARETRRVLVTETFRLVQERGEQPGVVMVWPVYDRAAGGGRESFRGFLQCVFRVHDLLATTHRRQPAAGLDVLFLDASERDPAKRVLYARLAGEAAAGGAVTESEFRSGLHREFELPFGERDWRVLFRPRPGWVEAQFTSMPFLRSGSFILLAGLLAGIVHILGRRADTIGREVEERTAELAESRRQIAHMLHALPGMAYRCAYDEQLNVMFVSEGARELTGWSSEDFVSGAAHFRDCIHPDDLPRVRDATRTALMERTDVEVEYRLRTRSGAEKWVLSRGRGVHDQAGKLRFFEGLAIDITAQKSAEAARLELERKLLEGQKLESLGLLAGGIAHDFNNLLSAILGNASLTRLSLPADSAADASLRAIEAASLRAAELCRQMLAYAGKGRFVIETVDLTALVEDLLSLLKISVGHHGALRLELARALPAVAVDVTQLRQVVMNLVLNATDAIAEGGGEIVITTGLMAADSKYFASCAAGAGLPAGDYVYVEVRDNGVGMSPEMQAKIFDPFFTTKFSGRGLGLAAVLGIVRGHHGALHVQSAPGAGSAFRLLLPPATQPVKPERKAASTPEERWRQSGTVLIVEDEEPVRVVTGEILKSYGLTPLLAADGEAGLELFKQNQAAIDLVLLDLLMPGLNGEQVLTRLRAIKPDVRVLLTSGYSEGDILGRLGGAPGKLAFIAKPFTRAALERKLREFFG